MKMLPVVVAVALAAALALVVLAGGLTPPYPPARPNEPEVMLIETATFPAVRILAKQQLADEVLAGRRPLTEAASLYAVLDSMPPAFTPRAEFDAPGGVVGGTEEHLCWHVLRYCRVRTDPQFGDDPVGASVAVARLEAELRAVVAGPGVRLPDPHSLPPVEGVLVEAWGNDRAKLHRSAPATRPGR